MLYTVSSYRVIAIIMLVSLLTASSYYLSIEDIDAQFGAIVYVANLFLQILFAYALLPLIGDKASEIILKIKSQSLNGQTKGVVNYFKDISSSLRLFERDSALENDERQEIKGYIEWFESRSPESRNETADSKSQDLPHYEWRDLARIIAQVMVIMKDDSNYFCDKGEIEKNTAEKVKAVKDIAHAKLFNALLWDIFAFTTKTVLLFVIMVVTNWAVSATFGLSELKFYVFLSWLAASIIVCRIFFSLFDFLINRYTEETKSKLDDLLVSSVNVIIVLLLGSGALLILDGKLPAHLSAEMTVIYSYLESPVYKIFVTIVVAIILCSLWQKILMRFLRKLALRTEQEHDDAFVDLLNWLGILVIIIIAGGAVAVILYDVAVGSNGADDKSAVLLPYSIFASVTLAIIGFSAQESLKILMHGIILQIDRPFNNGERLVLETGEICDVRSTGVRATKLYNVLENTEITMPNVLLNTRSVTNISRPNLQLRLQIPMYVSLANTDSRARTGIINTIEKIMIHIAYEHDEVSKLCIDVTTENEDYQTAYEKIVNQKRVALKDRKSIVECLNDIKLYYNDNKREITTKTSGTYKSREDDMIKAIYDNVILLKNARKNKYLTTVDSSSTCIDNIVESYLDLSRSIYAARDEHGINHSDINQLINELQREPVVFSEVHASELGQPYAKITLNCFTTHLERRHEVAHMLNKSIEEQVALHSYMQIPSTK